MTAHTEWTGTLDSGTRYKSVECEGGGSKLVFEKPVDIRPVGPRKLDNEYQNVDIIDEKEVLIDRKGGRTGKVPIKVQTFSRDVGRIAIPRDAIAPK